MTTTADRADFWNDQVWAAIDDGVTASVGAIRTAQKVFPTQPLAGTMSVPAGVFDPAKMSIAEGITKPYIELAVEFPLTNGQVNDDPTGSTAITVSKLGTKPYIELAVEFPLTNGQVNDDAAGSTAITVSKLGARSLALAEDRIFFLGEQAVEGVKRSGVHIESGQDSLGKGLLGLVSGQMIVTVDAPDPGAPTNSGGKILSAIAEGIAKLTGEMQAPPYALIEDTNAFAATWGSVINGAPAYTVLDPVLTGGIYGTGAMPPNTGLLIALGGDPTTIYISSDATTEPTHQDRGGLYYFRTFERVQYVAYDNRAFVRLDFSYLAGSGTMTPTTRRLEALRSHSRRSPEPRDERSRPGGRRLRQCSQPPSAAAKSGRLRDCHAARPAGGSSARAPELRSCGTSRTRDCP